MNKISLHIHQPGMGLDVLGKLKPPVVTVMDADRDLIVRMRTLLPDTHINVRIAEGDGKSWRNVAPTQRVNQILGIIRDCPRDRLTVEFFNEPLGHGAKKEDKAEYDRRLAEFIIIMQASGVEVSGLSLAEGNWTKDGPPFVGDFPKSLTVLNYISLHEYWWPRLHAPGMEGYHWRWPYILKQLDAAGLKHIKVIVSECGLCRAAAVGGGPDEGWLTKPDEVSVGSYADDLSQYNALMVQEPRMLGACVFDAWPMGRFGSFRINDTELMGRIYAIDAPVAPPEVPPPEPEPPKPDYWTYTVKAGDTLSKIAREFYGDAGKWPVIAEYNKLENPNLIFPGQVLRIPRLDVIPEEPEPKPPPQEEPMDIKVVDLENKERDFEYAKSKYGVAFRRAAVAPGQKVYRLVELREKTGQSALITQVLDKNGDPVANADVAFYWPGAPDPPDPPTTIYAHDWYRNFVHGPTNANGDVGPGMGKGAYHGRGEGGPHAVWVRDPSIPSDICEKLGMLAGTFHDHLDQKFRLTVSGGQEPGPPAESGMWREAGRTFTPGASRIVLHVSGGDLYDTRGDMKCGNWQIPEPIHPKAGVFFEFDTTYPENETRTYVAWIFRLPSRKRVSDEIACEFGPAKRGTYDVHLQWKGEGPPPAEPLPPDAELADLYLRLAANDEVLAAAFLARKQLDEAIAEKYDE